LEAVAATTDGLAVEYILKRFAKLKDEVFV
jgi:hypothetical protein